MQAVFDVLNRLFTLDAGSPEQHGDMLSAVIVRRGKTIPLGGVEFGFTLSVNGIETDAQSWPPVGVQFRKTDQDVLATYRLRWLPGDTVSVNVWLIDTAGERHEASSSFVAPVPPEPSPDAPLPPME